MSRTVLKLKGISRKGKNRVAECGEFWILQFIGRNGTSVGNWLIIPENKKIKNWADKQRWIHSFSDPDFDIVEVRHLEN